MDILLGFKVLFFSSCAVKNWLVCSFYNTHALASVGLPRAVTGGRGEEANYDSMLELLLGLAFPLLL